MPGKLPAIQFYPGDWKKDIGVQSLDWEPRAVWFEMLLLMHESEERGKLVLNGRPMTNFEVAKAIGMEEERFIRNSSKILASGAATYEQNTWSCRRMIRDENIRRSRAEAGSIGGSKTQANAKQKSTPSVSSSVSSSVSKRSTTPLTPQGEIEVPEDLKPNEPEIRNWLAYKREKGQRYKGTRGLGALWGMLRAIPASQRKAAIEQSMASNYAGIFPPKGDNNAKTGRNNSQGPYVQIKKPLITREPTTPTLL